MKKMKRLLLTLAISILSVMLTGCGASKAEITEVADSFLQAMVDGEWDVASSMCSEDMMTEFGFDMLQPGYLESYFYDGIGIDKALLSTEAQASITEFVQGIADNMVQSYVINDVIIYKGAGTVSATITTFDEESADPFSDPAMEEKVTALMETYAEEHMSELLQIYMTEGEEGMMVAMFNDLIPELLDIVSGSMNNIETTETIIHFKVVKNDDNWVITNSIDN